MTETAVAEPVETKAQVSSPYVGLAPFTEADARFFSGRNLDIEVVAANLRANRLTLLYGASGVGKSSLINAGVVHRLRQISRKTALQRGAPEFIIATFREWTCDPIDGIADCLLKAASEVTASPLRVPQTRDLSQFLATFSALTGAQLLIILDQFEDYVLNPEHVVKEGTFAYEFPRAIERNDIPVNILVSMREDTIASLDFFKGRFTAATDPFINRLQIKHLDKNSARRAIIDPIKVYNEIKLLSDENEQYQADEDLVQRVIGDLEVDKVALSSQGQAKRSPDTEHGHVETSYLQLVMTRVWEEEVNTNSRRLQLKTYLERLGGAQRIIETHVDKVMNAFSTVERDLAAKFIHFTVTRHGMKSPTNAYTLAEMADLLPTDGQSDEKIENRVSQIQQVIEKLSSGKARIFKNVKPPVSRGFSEDDPRGKKFFELTHDALSPAILSWRKQYMEKRAANLAKAKAVKQAKAKLKEDELNRQRQLEQKENERRLLDQQRENEYKLWQQKQKFRDSIKAILIVSVFLLLVAAIGVLYFYNKSKQTFIESLEDEKADLGKMAETENTRADQFQDNTYLYEKRLAESTSLLDILKNLAGVENTKNIGLARLREKAENNEIPDDYKELFVNSLREAKFPAAKQQEVNEVIGLINGSSGKNLQLINPSSASAIIYLQIQDTSQKQAADKVREALKTKGYIAPLIENVGKINLLKNQIRYFRDGDRELAEQIQKELTEMQIPAETRLIPGYEDNQLVRPRQLELWFTSGPIPEIDTAGATKQ